MKHLIGRARQLLWLVPLASVAVTFKIIAEVRGRMHLQDVLLAPRTDAWFASGPLGLAADLSTRIQWGVTTAAFILLWCTTVAVCVHIAGTTLSHSWRRSRRDVLLLLGFVVGGCVWLSLAKDDQVALTVTPVSELLRTIGSFDTQPQLYPSVVWMGRMALSAALALAAALCSLLLPGNDRAVGALRWRVVALRRLLYVGAIVLAAAVLQTRTTHQFIPANAGQEFAEEAGNVANAVTAGMGSYWTLVLLAMYVPAATWIRGSTLEAARDAAPDPTPEALDQWIEKEGLALSMPQQLTRLAALLAPFLAGGPLNLLLEQLTRS